MRKNQQLAYFMLFLSPVVLLLAGASLFGQSPFDGTWRANMEQAKFSPKSIIFYLNKGAYDCSSCRPKIHVRADGQEQSVTGQAYDKISVREVDPRSIEVTATKKGKIVFYQSQTVSDGGNTLTVNTTSYPENSVQLVTAEATATRVGKAPAGANGASGSWQINKVKESENGLTTTYKMSGDELSMSTPTGESYTAKLDGRDYPFKGAYAYDTVSVKRVDEHTIEETDKREGKAVNVVKMSVAPDGMKMTVVATDKLTGQTLTYIAEKQRILGGVV